MKDYYDILAVSKDASQPEIKKSFRKLAQKYHPDKTQGEEAASNKFKEINEAYQVLSDKQKRQEYDAQSLGLGHPGGSFDPFSDLGDLFSDIFGGGNRRKRQAVDPVVSFSIPISELRSSQPLSVSFKIDNDVSCIDCKGNGGDSREACKSCNGAGKIINTFQKGSMRFQGVTSCSNCYGTGTVIKNVCRTCLGNGSTKKEEIFDVILTSKPRKG